MKEPSRRTRVRRQPARGHYEFESVCDVLDAGLIAHMAFVDAGQPFCIPMLEARIASDVYIHGASVSRTMRLLASGVPACLTVTIVDGLVLARSAFEHSANYRSAVVLGSFRRVDDAAERLAALRGLTNKLIPGRWDEVRLPNQQELKATSVLAIRLDEASVKIRTGPPTDDASADAALDIWAGVLPIAMAFGKPWPSPGLRPGIRVAQSLESLLRSDPPKLSSSRPAIRSC